MAVYNTKFIKDILSIDERILKFAILIRYWASRQKLSGSIVEGGGLAVSNYALTMMIIFYLQCENILPPVKKLQENLSDEESIVIDGWQFGYNKTYAENIKDYTNEHSEWKWKSWLHRFFYFYLSFSYEDLVLSPYAGRAIPRTSFQKLALSLNKVKGQPLPTATNVDESSISEGLRLYWNRLKDGNSNLLCLSARLCIQDPFELNYCVSKRLNRVGLLNWKNICLASMQHLENELFFKRGILDIFQNTCVPPRNKMEQGRIITKIQSVIESEKKVS